jgi:hypothetical protein
MILVAASHHISNGDPSLTMFFLYASIGTQSGVSGAKVDVLIQQASTAVGDGRTKLSGRSSFLICTTISLQTSCSSI